MMVAFLLAMVCHVMIMMMMVVLMVMVLQPSLLPRLL
jgi:hypothetical protein